MNTWYLLGCPLLIENILLTVDCLPVALGKRKMVRYKMKKEYCKKGQVHYKMEQVHCKMVMGRYMRVMELHIRSQEDCILKSQHQTSYQVHHQNWRARVAKRCIGGLKGYWIILSDLTIYVTVPASNRNCGIKLIVTEVESDVAVDKYNLASSLSEPMISCSPLYWKYDLANSTNINIKL